MTHSTELTEENDTLIEALTEACKVIDMLQAKLHAANVPCGEMDEILLSQAYSKIRRAVSKAEGRL